MSLVAVSVSLLACMDPCVNKTLTELPSPGASNRAVVFERSCGATTDVSTHVSILNAGEVLPKSPGNVFIADRDHGAVKDMAVTARWTSQRDLVIRYPARARVFKKEPQARGVAVVYVTTP